MISPASNLKSVSIDTLIMRAAPTPKGNYQFQRLEEVIVDVMETLSSSNLHNTRLDLLLDDEMWFHSLSSQLCEFGRKHELTLAISEAISISDISGFSPPSSFFLQTLASFTRLQGLEIYRHHFPCATIFDSPRNWKLLLSSSIRNLSLNTFKELPSKLESLRLTHGKDRIELTGTTFLVDGTPPH